MSQKALSFEEILEAEGSLTYSFRGVSMRPLLHQGRGLFIVEKREPPYHPGEVILFRRGSQYVLHRIIEAGRESYTALGDNSVQPDENIRLQDILGVMTGFVRKGRRHSVKEPGYRLYTRLWMTGRPLRVFYKKSKAKLRKKLSWIKGQ